MGPRRAPALGLDIAAVLGLLARSATAAPHFDCRLGSVAFETVHLPGRNVVLLRQGPRCPVVAPEPHTTAGVAEVVDDAPGGAFLSPSSALHGGRPQGHSAAKGRDPTPTAALAVVAGVLTVMAISVVGRNRSVRRPELLAQKAAEEEAGAAAHPDGEEAERRAREEMEHVARGEAERRAREEATLEALVEYYSAEATALQAQEEAIEAAPVGARSPKSGASKCRYDDHTHAFQLARQKEEEERKKSQQESDGVHKAERPAGSPEPEKKGRRGPCGCSSGKGAAEPGRR